MKPMIKRAFRIIGLGLGAILCAGVAYWIINIPDKNMRGVWRSDGYGLLLDISTTALKIYEFSDAGSCIHFISLPANLDLVRRLSGYDFKVLNDQIVVDVAEITNDVHGSKIPTLPTACSVPENPAPQTTLNIFLSTFAKHYPNFELYGIDWATRTTEANQKLSQGIPLDQVLRETLDGLEDSHVSIDFVNNDADRAVFHAKPDPKWSSDRRKYFDVGAAYLESPLIELRNDGVYHGWLPNKIAYVAIVQMGADTPFPQHSVDRANELTQELASTYGDAEAIILDLRYNSGGYDTVALSYASLLSTTPWVIGQKSVQTSPQTYHPWVSVEAFGSETALEIPAAVLTSSYTVSAAEIGLLALRELSNVTVIGEHTAGALSDMMERQLPNGWNFSLPHQVYEAVDGSRFEGPGIPPDIIVPMNIEAFDLGRDHILEAATTHLRKQP